MLGGKDNNTSGKMRIKGLARFINMSRNYEPIGGGFIYEPKMTVEFYLVSGKMEMLEPVDDLLMPAEITLDIEWRNGKQ